MIMRKLGGGRFFPALVTALLALLLTGCFSAADSPKLSLLNGDTVDVSAKPFLFINYWAPWCKPCHEEIPELNAFMQSNQAAMLGVNFDVFTDVYPVSELQAQAAQLNIEFGVLDAASSRALESHWQLPRPKGLPTTYIISAQGQWMATLLGPQTQQTLSTALTKAKQRMRSVD